MILTFVTVTLTVLTIFLFIILFFEYILALPEQSFKITFVILLGVCFFQTPIGVANHDWITTIINALVCIIGSNFAMFQSLSKKIKP
jgi:hypothetical protein